MKKVLDEKIINKKAKIGIVGLGYVGLPLAMQFVRSGFVTYGFDIDHMKVSSLRKGESYISHISADTIKQIVSNKAFHPTTDFSKLSNVDCIAICVPTPVTETKEPDLTPVVKTAETIAKYLRKGQLVVLESTTYPGTTDDVMRPILETAGLCAGKDFYLAFSPEREDPGNKTFSTKVIPKVVGGIDKVSTEIAVCLYRQVMEKVIIVSSAKIAEATKMLENTFRAVNIALVNELKMLFDKVGVDIWEVIEASKTKPFGYMPFYPGPGWGGHCIPVDPFYLSWLGRKHDFITKFIDIAGEINIKMPEYVLAKTVDALNHRGKPLKDSKILILGLSYKKDIGDPRESPSFKIIELLEDEEAKVDYNDPFIPVSPKMRHFNIEKKSVKITPDLIRKYDCVIIVTDHSSYDYEMIRKNAKLIIDTRNAIKSNDKKVIKA
jgi:UDP-N-acetyl-D-glucosamine dehydrogenase